MSKYFFLLSIGPVQSFIKDARKTQDLYSGSQLLSDLMQEVLYFLSSKISATLIFPRIDTKKQSKENVSLPNKLLVEIDLEKIEDFRKELIHANSHSIDWLGAYIKALFYEQLNIKWNEIKPSLKKLSPDQINKFDTAVNNQLQNHLEIYWSAYPSDNYSIGFREVHRLLGSAKHSRVFIQLMESGRKCNLNGTRNVLIYRDNEDQKRRKRKPKFITSEAVSIDSRMLYTGEGLSAISFLKRRYRYSRFSSFESTAEIALMQTLNALKKLENQKVNHTISQIRGINTQFFYEENTRDEAVLKILKNEKTSILASAIQEYQKTIAEAAHKNELKLNRYYAIVMFDGDDMGKWWSSDEALIRSDINQSTYHQELAAFLSQFAVQATQILETKREQRGRKVYAGGDDFLGFICLDHLMPVINELRTGFQNSYNSTIGKYALEGKRMSFSAGVVIAHYKEPLRLVLKSLREAEKQAKKWRGKDAFCIRVLRSSGKPTEFVMPFFGEGDSSILDLSDKVIASMQQHFANGTIGKIMEQLKIFPLSEMSVDIRQDQALIKPKLWHQLLNSCLLSKTDPKCLTVIENVFNDLWTLTKASSSWMNAIAMLECYGFIIRQTIISPLKNQGSNDTEHSN